MASKLTTVRVLLLSLFAGALLARDARAEGRPAYGETVRASLLEEPLVIDPVAVKTHTDLMVVSLLFDSLYRVKNGKIVPQLAATMPDFRDPLAVVIALRPGVIFHNKNPLKPSDVVSSLTRLRKSRMSHFLGNIVSIVEGPALEESGLQTVVLTLRTPDLKLAKRLCDVHTAITENGKAPTWRRPIGTGAFRLKERSNSKKELRLVAFDSHLAGRSYVDELRLRWHEDGSSEARLYETGNSHLSMRGDIAFAGHRPKYRTNQQQSGPWILSYIGFGRGQAIDTEREFRQFVSAAVGRLGMKQIGSGERLAPTLSPVPDELRKVPMRQKGLAVDRRRAATLLGALETRFEKLRSGGLKLEILVNRSRPDDAAIAGKVAAALFSFGIQSKIVSLHASVFSARVQARRCDLYIGQQALTSFSGNDALLASFVIARAPARRMSRAGLEKRFSETMPLVPLFHRSLAVHYRSDVYGLSFAPLAPGRRGARLQYEDLYFFGSAERNE